ncbi:MAG: tetratricopeptide repeat protein [Candidatus Omnitrophota bacterium]
MKKMIHDLRKGLCFLLSRVFILYILTFLFVSFVFNKKEVTSAKMVALNRLMPYPLSYLYQFSEDHRYYDKEQLESHVAYFERVINYVPNRADAFGALGFCHYYLGRNSEAIASLEKAIKHKPDIFWFHYNLGMIYFREQKYALAIKSFEDAAQTSLIRTLTYVFSSRIYKNIMRDIPERVEEVKVNLEESFKNCARMIVLSNYYAKDYQQALNHATAWIDQHPREKDPFFHCYAGTASFQLQDYGSALFFLQRAIELDPENADSYYFLGLSLRAKGESQDSTRAFQKSVILRQKQKSALKFEDKIDVKIF